jgi:hypothetical protein
MGKISTAEVLRLRAPQALYHAINLCGAPLRMTILWEFIDWTYCFGDGWNSNGAK